MAALIPPGDDLSGWTPRPFPPETPLNGRYCRLERLTVERHQSDLADTFMSAHASAWDYLPYGPFESRPDAKAWIKASALKSDPLFHAIIQRGSGTKLGVDDYARGLASLMRIDQANGVIEVGHIHFGPSLKQTPAATEAIYLLMSRVFDELGYRRLEWKCNAANLASRSAALRFGFTYEGTFRQATIAKGRNRDTAWFSLLDREWPGMKAAFTAWLDPSNFDASGNQRRPLSSFKVS